MQTRWRHLSRRDVANGPRERLAITRELPVRQVRYYGLCRGVCRASKGWVGTSSRRLLAISPPTPSERRADSSTMTANDELIRARRPLASLANHGQTRWPLLTLEVNGCGVELCARCWSQASSFSKVSKSLRKSRVGAASRKITRKTMSCANRYAQACCAIPLAYSPRHTLSRRSPKSACCRTCGRQIR